MELLAILMPTIGAILLAIVGTRLGRSMAAAQGALVNAQTQLAKAQAENEEGATTETLSKSAKLQIETYTDLIVKPLRDRLDEISKDLITTKSTLKGTQDKLDKTTEELLKSRAENSIIRDELFDMKVTFKQIGDSLDYLIGEVKESFPDQVKRAVKIRKGEPITGPLRKLPQP